jgi:hypothetical protein
MRFLDGEHVDKKNWGRPFHLTDIGDGCLAIDENLTGAKGPRSIVDTGCDHDGLLVSKLFQQWTNHTTSPARGEIRFPKGKLGGEIYRDLELSELAPSDHDSHVRFNTIGLHVLSQNLVTFDFPNRTMYLKRSSDWPLSKENETAAKSAADFAHSLKEKERQKNWISAPWERHIRNVNDWGDRRRA